MTVGNLARIFLGLGLPFAAGTHAAPATEQSQPLETQVKAAFIPKFASYVSWPSSMMGAPDDPILLCIIGRDPFGSGLEETTTRQRVDQHPFVVRRLDSTAGATNCHIAFLSGSAKESPAAMQEALRGKPILTVTDASLGATRGMVHFTVKDGRVRFYIDDALAARSNLAISARLLSLALGVKPRARTS
jgi:hypothetical protein